MASVKWRLRAELGRGNGGQSRQWPLGAILAEYAGGKILTVSCGAGEFVERRIRWPGARTVRSGALAGAGEMEQSVKCPVKYVLRKANDLSSDPQDPCKRLSNTAFACNSSTSNVL